MKKILLILTIGLLFPLKSQAQDLWNFMWKCEWIGQTQWTVLNEDHCRGTRSMTCTHILWGTQRTDEYTWIQGCQGSVNGLSPTAEPPIGTIISVRSIMIAEKMRIIRDGGTFVPDKYCNPDSLINNPVIRNDAIAYRYQLAGYDVNTFNLANPCYVPTTTLPIIVPADGSIPVDINCITINPNPATSTLNINFGNYKKWVSKYQLIEISTGNIVLQKLGSINSIESIAVGGYTRGNYKIAIFDLYNNVGYKNIILE